MLANSVHVQFSSLIWLQLKARDNASERFVKMLQHGNYWKGMEKSSLAAM